MLWTGRYYIGYAARRGGKTRICLVRTFRRWIVTSGARNSQRHRRRELMHLAG